MKLILSLSLFVLYTVHALPTGDDAQPNYRRVHETGPFKSIRKATANLSPTARRFGSGDSLPDIQCAMSCFTEMYEKTQREFPNFDQRQAAKVAGEFDLEQLNKLCTIHDTAKACYDRCENSQMKTQMTKGDALMQYLCHDSTIKQNAACLLEVSQLMNVTCEAPTKCGQYMQKVDQHLNQSSQMDQSGLKDILTASCQYIKCDLDCEKSTVVQKCGQQAQDDVEGLTRKAAEFLKDLVESMGMGSVYPRECDRVAA